MKDLEKTLSGGDLRSIGKSNFVASNIKNQTDFDKLFISLLHNDRLVVMRAADTIEKITISHPSYLAKHKKEILDLCDLAINKELLWHLALLIPRLHLNKSEFAKAWATLTKWAKDSNNSRIVRVNSLQGLSDLVQREKDLFKDFKMILVEMEKENIPSINARIRIIRKQISS